MLFRQNDPVYVVIDNVAYPGRVLAVVNGRYRVALIRHQLVMNATEDDLLAVTPQAMKRLGFGGAVDAAYANVVY